MTENILQTGVRHVHEVRDINRELTEKALHMRCLAYLSEVKARLLTATIFEIDRSKKNLLQINEKLIHQSETIVGQKEQLEQQNKELALFNQSVQQRLLLHREQTPLGVIEWNSEFEVTDWNPSAERIFNFTSDEAIGRNLVSLIVAENAREEATNAWSDLMANKQSVQQINENITRQGKIRLCEWYSTPLVGEDGHVIGVTSLVEDITERKQIEEDLHKLGLAVKQSPESIVITNLDAEIEYVNEAFLRTTGYKREEVIGKNPRFKQSGKTSPKTYEKMWDSLTHGRPWKGELYNKRKDGSEHVEMALITPLSQADGTITHYVAVQEDITEKKLLAEELDQHRHHLEQLVKERTAQLADAVQLADDANLAKSTFLANMSHEIRTPMNAIIGLTHLLQRSDPTAEQLDRLIRIDTSAGHLLSIINDILDISKIEAGKLTLEQADFHVDAIFDHVQSLLRDQARSKGLTIKVTQSKVPHWLKGDLTRLRQALLNYVGNAIKFTEKGSIFLRAKELKARDDEVLVRFEVQDSGIGIQSDKLAGLFEAFEQANTSTTRKHGGTGLGLAITRRLAQLMGGEAGVKSAPGRGSTFWFTAWLGRGHGVLPTVPTEKLVDAETLLRTQFAGSRILLVEDNAINREVAVALLSSVDLTVDTAENGREAVDKVHATAYDLILMDIQMPEMDGWEATRLIRSVASCADLPILAMTANVFEEDRQTCLEVGMNDFIGKPIDLENLYAAIAKWLSKHTD